MASTSSLHDHALQAEKHLEQLATGLAAAGVAPNQVQTVSKMADVCRQIVQQLGKGQEQTGDNEPPGAAQEPSEPGGPEGGEPRHTMESATDALHRDMVASSGR